MIEATVVTMGHNENEITHNRRSAELCLHFILHNSYFILAVEGTAVGFIDWLGLAMEQRGNVEPEDYLPNKDHDSHYRMRANAP